MGIVYFTKPQFLVDHTVKSDLRKYMFIRKGGKAIHHGTGMDISRNVFDVELICISNENEACWIGNYAEGFGFLNIHFAKEDCRDATDEEVELWLKDHESVMF